MEARELAGLSEVIISSAFSGPLAWTMGAMAIAAAVTAGFMKLMGKRLSKLSFAWAMVSGMAFVPAIVMAAGAIGFRNGSLALSSSRDAPMQVLAGAAMLSIAILPATAQTTVFVGRGKR